MLFIFKGRISANQLLFSGIILLNGKKEHELTDEPQNHACSIECLFPEVIVWTKLIRTVIFLLQNVITGLDVFFTYFVGFTDTLSDVRIARICAITHE